MPKVYLMPVSRLNLQELSKMLKQAKADARNTKAASTVEGGKADESKAA